MNFLVIGSGKIAQRHIENIKLIDESAEVSLLTREKGNFKKNNLKEKISIKNVFTNENEAIESNPDYVIICNPSPFHIKSALFFAKQGIHLFIEKPLSNNLDDIDLLQMEVKKRSIKAMVGYPLRFCRSMISFKHAIEEGIIGDVLRIRSECYSYLPSWRPEMDFKKTVSANNDLGGGVLLELSHELDYLMWIFGKGNLKLSTTKKLQFLDLDVEDYAFLLLEYKNDLKKEFIAEVSLDFFSRTSKRTCEVFGSEGKLTWDGLNRTVKFFDYSNYQNVELFDGADCESNDMYVAEMEYFLSCIEKNIEVSPSLLESRELIKLIITAKNEN